MINKKFIYPSLTLVSAGLITFEIFMLRFFSLAHFGSYVYIPISIAILGVGAGATVLTIFEKPIAKKSDLFLGISLALAIFFTSSGFFVLKQIELHPTNLFGSYLIFKEILNILIFYFFLILPFFFGGFFIVLCYHTAKNHLGHLSLFDMIGAAGGAVLFMGALFVVPISFLIFIPVSLLALAAFLIISHEEKKYRLILYMLTLVALLLPFAKSSIDPMPYKDVSRSLKNGGKLVYEEESHFGKLQIIKNPKNSLKIGTSPVYTEAKPGIQEIYVDGNRVSELIEGKNLDFFNYTPYRLAYQLKPDASTLVLGSGGGLGVTAAIYFNTKNSSRVDAVEKNHQVIQLLKDRFSNYTGGIYHNRNVMFYRSEVRPFTASHKLKYQLIQLSIPFLQENSFREEPNYNLTYEAIKQYFKLLNKDGMLMVSVFLQKPARLELRLLATLKKALESSGSDPTKSLIAFKTSESFVVFVKPSGFTGAEQKLSSEVLTSLKYPQILPTAQHKSELAEWANTVIKGDESKIATYPFSLKPITDASPYLFYSIKLGTVFSGGNVPFEELGYLLILLTFVLSVFISMGTIYLPVLLKKDYSKKVHVSKVILYFGGTGAGYMMIEMILIQKLHVLFSSILLSAGLVFVSIFLFSGLGAYVGRHFKKKATGLIVSLSALIILLLLYFFFLDNMISWMLSKSIISRFALALAFLSPLAFVMGIPFSLALEWIKYFEEKVVPWCWSVNTGFSVIGTVSALLLGIKIGFFWTWGIAILLFVIALGSFIWMDLYYQKTNYLYRRYKV